MINLTELEMFLVTCIPSLVAVLSSLSSLVSIIKNLKNLRDNESLKAERDALAEQNKLVVAECKKMRKQIAFYIQKAVKVSYNDITEVKDDKDLQV